MKDCKMPEAIADMKDKRIRKAFEEQGNSAEHNYYHYLNVGSRHKSSVFPLFENKYGIMGFEDESIMWCYSNPLAPKEKQAEIFLGFVRWAFGMGIKKIRSEVDEELWKNIVGSLDNRYRAVKPSFVFYWPVFNLDMWSSELSGNKLKKFRNMKNRFMKEHKIEAVGKDEVSRKDLLGLVEKWKISRSGNDRVHDEQYISAIKTDFIGYDSVRIILIDGCVKILNGGWKIPNSNTFYSQLGIHDYSIEGLGEFSCIEDLISLKSMGFDFADFGGSTEPILDFKKKFMPAYVYKTVEFSIVMP